MKHFSSNILMISPDKFRSNELTLDDNVFQSNELSNNNITKNALVEFEELKNKIETRSRSVAPTVRVSPFVPWSRQWSCTRGTFR